MSLAVPGLSCGIQALVPCLGIKSGPAALGVWSLSCWTTREVPRKYLLSGSTVCFCCPGHLPRQHEAGREMEPQVFFLTGSKKP